ncbi:hypothetical protein pclt_cds_428 [Pandoravirus celtis]|uniref:Uncharacterized protein n=1 Tax=Pandoravirus celtis TaxID=2568002 RepID=A0A4D6EH43_9VIRU|nr:hypothetical protein pclt_cds_428 [Pandoravirus celtis]
MSLVNAFGAAIGNNTNNGRRSVRRRGTTALYQEAADDDGAQGLDAVAYANGLSDNEEDGDVGSAGSDIEGSDGEQANGDAAGTRSRTARPRGPRASFLSLVSPAPSARRPSARRAEQRHPYVRRYAGTRLQSNSPKYAFTYQSGMTDEPQYMSTGMIRGTIATMSLPELRLAVAYMLEHADPDGRWPTMLEHPANFERFEDLREATGGRDILLHEIFKENNDVLTDLFLIAGRVGYNGARARTIGQRASDLLGSAVSSSSSLSTANDIPYERLRRPANFRPALTRPEYRVINPGALVPLLANVAGTGDDPSILTAEQPRPIEGHVDGNPGHLKPLCGKGLNKFFSRTANEHLDDPNLAQFIPQRQGLAEFSRSMCPIDKETVDNIIGQLRRDERVDARGPLAEDVIDGLLRNGFKREYIDRTWGPNGNRAVAPA